MLVSMLSFIVFAGTAHLAGGPGSRIAAALPHPEPSAARAAAGRRVGQELAREQRLGVRRRDRGVAAAAAHRRPRRPAAALVGDRRLRSSFFIYLDDVLYYSFHRTMHRPGSTSACTAGTTASSRRGRSPGTTCTRSSSRSPASVALIGPLLLGSHVVTVWIWFAFRQWEAAEGHCGYDLPWTPTHLLPGNDGARHHDWHHARVKGQLRRVPHLDGPGLRDVRARLRRGARGASRVSGWFDTARFGLFVHWGHCSASRASSCRGRWSAACRRCRACQDVPVDEYYRDDRHLRAAAGTPARVGALARSARHAVRRAHHQAPRRLRAVRHDACRTSRSMRSPYGGDIVREFVDAVRAEGLRVGLYFSLTDWHHPDYPPFTDADRPYALRHACRGRRRSSGQRFVDVPVRAGARAADRLRADRRAVVRRRLGAQRASMARATELREHDPRAAAGDPDQRPPARARRLRHARAVRPAAAAGARRGRPA